MQMNLQVNGKAASLDLPVNTLLVTYSGFHVGTPNLFKNLQWDPLKDFAAVSMIATSPQVIVVRPTLPVHSLQELIDYARKNPGKLNYASSGNGSVGHVAAELFKQVTATNMVHPRNSSWMRPSVPRAAGLARRDEAAHGSSQ